MLQADELECERGGKRLFRGLSFALGPGEALRVAGANGSGKTSLLRILCGLAAPGAGEVRWQGTPIRRLREEYTTQLVYLGHAPALKDDLTAAENLAISCTIAGIGASPASVREALARLGLAGKDIPARRLSQGQRRRAALARLCLSQAVPLWLLDEPFTALDLRGVELLKAIVGAHIARGGALAYTTHQDVGMGPARVVDLDRAGA